MNHVITMEVFRNNVSDAWNNSINLKQKKEQSIGYFGRNVYSNDLTCQLVN